MSIKKHPPKRTGLGFIYITSGIFKGQTLSVPKGNTVRPTSNRARQALFDRLEHSFLNYGFRLRGAQIIDIFAGSGALGLEALSRGAAQATFVEQNPISLQSLKHNITILGVEDKTSLLTLDATTLPAAPQPYDLALVDPPYESGLANQVLKILAEKDWMKSSGLMVVETSRNEKIISPKGWNVENNRAYGRGTLTYLTRSSY